MSNSERVNDGGPAFPAKQHYTDLHQSGGMSLRDYFAAKAMHAELMTCGIPGQAADCLVRGAERDGRTVEAQMAFNAYTMADAMLAARGPQS